MDFPAETAEPCSTNSKPMSWGWMQGERSDTGWTKMLPSAAVTYFGCSHCFWDIMDEVDANGYEVLWRHEGLQRDQSPECPSAVLAIVCSQCLCSYSCLKSSSANYGGLRRWVTETWAPVSWKSIGLTRSYSAAQQELGSREVSRLLAVTQYGYRALRCDSGQLFPCWYKRSEVKRGGRTWLGALGARAEAVEKNQPRVLSMKIFERHNKEERLCLKTAN